jgi:hypothetical protein
VDGSENVIFCDRRGDPGNRSYFMVLARSNDGGQTFKNYAWSTQASDPKDVFMGDYMGIAAYGSKVYGIWARTATAEEIKSETQKDREPPAAKEESAGDEKLAQKAKLKGLFIEIGLADFTTGSR